MNRWGTIPAWQWRKLYGKCMQRLHDIDYDPSITDLERGRILQAYWLVRQNCDYSILAN